MRLSDLSPNDVVASVKTADQAPPLKLSDLDPKDVQPASPVSGGGAFSLGTIEQATSGHFQSDIAPWLAKHGVGSLSPEEMNARMNQAKEEHPYLYKTGQVVGGALQAIPIAKGLQSLGAIPQVAKGFIPGALSGAAIAGTQGVLQKPDLEPGESEVGARLKGGLTSAIPGAIGGGLGGYLNKVTSPQATEEAAYEALQPTKADRLRAGREVPKLGEEGTKEALKNQVGRAALEEGIITKMPASYEELAHRAGEAVEKRGEEIGQHIKNISSALKEHAGENAILGLHRDSILGSASKEIDQLREIPALGSDVRVFERGIKDAETKWPEYIPIEKAQELKSQIGKQINWKRPPGADIPTKEKVLRFLYDRLGTGIEDAADSAAPILGPDAKDAYLLAKQRYGAAKEIARLTNRYAASSAANRHLGLLDYMVGEGGGAMAAAKHGSAAGLLTAPAAAFAHHGIRLYGPQVKAALPYTLMKDSLARPALQLATQPGLLPGGLKGLATPAGRSP
jgi:hypothetical protein